MRELFLPNWCLNTTPAGRANRGAISPLLARKMAPQTGFAALANRHARSGTRFRIMAIVMLGSLPSFLATPLPADSQTGPPPGKSDAPSQKVITSEMEINKLVAGLGDRDFIVREKSTARLKEVGLPALQYLQDTLDSANLETRLRAETLVTEIRTGNRLPTRVKALEFKLVVNKIEWKIPESGGKTTIEIKLEVTNVGKAISNLYLPGSESRVVLMYCLSRIWKNAPFGLA
jgi:hypothetical protein